MTARLAAWWLRTIRRHFCFACDRTTLHAHRHSDAEMTRCLREMSPWT